MKCLGFSREASIVSGRRIRSTCFEDRSMFPVSAACLVANAMRETLSQLLLTAAGVRLTEPVLPDARGWRAIGEGARVYRTRGAGLDAALVLRAADAQAIAGAAFGESRIAARALSGIESTVLDRIANALAGNLAPVVGLEAEPARPCDGVSGLSTYFEVLLERPVYARIGVGLSRDPSVNGPGNLGVDALHDVDVSLAVRCEGASLPVGRLWEIDVGDVVPLTQTLHGIVYLAGSPLGRGEVGVKGGRYAFAFGPPTVMERGNAPSL